MVVQNLIKNKNVINLIKNLLRIGCYQLGNSLIGGFGENFRISQNEIKNDFITRFIEKNKEKLVSLDFYINERGNIEIELVKDRIHQLKVQVISDNDFEFFSGEHTVYHREMGRAFRTICELRKMNRIKRFNIFERSSSVEISKKIFKRVKNIIVSKDHIFLYYMVMDCGYYSLRQYIGIEIKLNQEILINAHDLIDWRQHNTLKIENVNSNIFNDMNVYFFADHPNQVGVNSVISPKTIIDAAKIIKFADMINS